MGQICPLHPPSVQLGCEISPVDIGLKQRFSFGVHLRKFWGSVFTSVLDVVVFIPALSHASAKLFNARWKPDSVEESRTKSSANS